MTNRSPINVLLLSLFTGGIYGMFWLYWTKQEMVAAGAEIPTMWLIWIPFVSVYWLWKLSVGVGVATGGKTEGTTAFLLAYLLGGIGYAILQSGFNEANAAS